MKIVDFVFQMRIIKDEEFDKIYVGLVGRFKEREEIIKAILV